MYTTGGLNHLKIHRPMSAMSVYARNSDLVFGRVRVDGVYIAGCGDVVGR